MCLVNRVISLYFQTVRACSVQPTPSVETGSVSVGRTTSALLDQMTTAEAQRVRFLDLIQNSIIIVQIFLLQHQFRNAKASTPIAFFVAHLMKGLACGKF